MKNKQGFSALVAVLVWTFLTLSALWLQVWWVPTEPTGVHWVDTCGILG